MSPAARLFHVPSAWVAYLAFAVVFIGSMPSVRTETDTGPPCHGAAEIGVVFDTLVFITGPIWARPCWGTWWQWDARLTSALVMWLTYMGYLFLRALAARSVPNHRTAVRPSSDGRFPQCADRPFLQGLLVANAPPKARQPPISFGTPGLGGPELLAFFTALAAYAV